MFLMLALVISMSAGLSFAQNFEAVDSIRTAGPISQIMIQDCYCYIAESDSGFQIIDISNPPRPIFVGEYNSPVFHMHVSSNYAYVVPMNNDGMSIIDISDPSNPTMVEYFHSPGAECIFVSGSYAYLGGGDSLKIIDVSDPTNPVQRSSCYFWSPSGPIFVESGIAYIEHVEDIFWPPTGFLDAYDISNPENPFFLWTYVCDPASFLVASGFAYLASIGAMDSWGVFKIITVPGLQEVYSEDWGRSSALSFMDHYLCILEIEPYAIRVLDISDPSQPDTIVTYNLHFLPSDISAEGEYVYVSGRHWLHIYRFESTSTEDYLSPQEFSFAQNYPNPFNGHTTISYSLPQTSDVTIDIFDILGRTVETIAKGIKSAGNHQVIWDASGQSSGIYFYRIKSGDKAETKRMTLIK